MTEVVDLVLLEGSDEGALVLVEDQLGDELSHSLDVEELHDVDLVSQFARRLLVSLQSVQPTLEPGLLFEATAARVEDGGAEVLRVVVPVFAALGDCPHHGVFGLAFVGRDVTTVKVLRGGRVDAAYQGVFKLEGLVTTEDKSERGPHNARNATDETEDYVEGADGPLELVLNARLTVYDLNEVVVTLFFIAVLALTLDDIVCEIRSQVENRNVRRVQPLEGEE